MYTSRNLPLNVCLTCLQDRNKCQNTNKIIPFLHQYFPSASDELIIYKFNMYSRSY